VDRILLVGATGFLGACVAARLVDRAPVAFVRPTSDVSVLPPGLELRYGQLEDRRLPLDGISTLVYSASMGFGHIPPLVAQLEAAGVQRAVFVSTTAIFTGLATTSRAIRLQAEDSVQRSSLQWTILRPTMIYGTARDRNISRLLRFLKRCPLFVGPLRGDALWQPIYMADLADALIRALDSPLTERRVYNVAGAAPVRFSELVATAGRAVGRRVVLVRVPLEAVILAARVSRIITPEQVRRLAEDKAFSYAEAATDFGFSPRTFAEGVRLEARSLGLT
jgi:nucleoside-diphosphate-sugar epimerase